MEDAYTSNYTYPKFATARSVELFFFGQQL